MLSVMSRNEALLADYDELPYRTATFLYTDIEGSTAVWHIRTLIPARDSILSTEDLLRRHIANYGGRVFRSVGDGLCAVFDDVVNAVKCAASAQTELSQVNHLADLLPVRMALATGEVWERSGEFYGGSAHLVARLVDLAHGAQVVLCSRTAKVLSEAKDSEHTSKSLGSYYLRGFDRAHEVFQLIHPKLRSEFSPLRSIQSAWTNLPDEQDSFVGRSSELKSIDHAFSISRIVTVLGSGGIGKTRLCLQWARNRTSIDGMWFVELASLREQTLVAQAIARTIGIAEDPDVPTVKTICETIGVQATTILLDNCEHVVVGSAAVVEIMLQRCPHLRILITSREPLGLPGEHQIRLSPLKVRKPVSSNTNSSDQLSDALVLFYERAKAIQPTFKIDSQTVLQVTRICRRVEGVPLAIELAASRLRSMPLDDLAERLDSNFALLRSSRSDGNRSSAIENTIRWSFRLLENNEIELLHRLSSFVSGFTLDAAEYVCAFGAISADDISELLFRLVDKSLVSFSESSDGSRYNMLESIRELAYSEHCQRGEFEATLRQHSRWAVTLAEKIENDLWNKQTDAIRRVSVELPNFRIVMSRSLNEVDSEYGIRVCSALFRFWMIRGTLKEPIDWLNRLLSIPNPNLNESIEAIAYAALGGLARAAGDLDQAEEGFNKSAALWQTIGDDAGVADGVNNLGLVAGDRGDTELSFDLLQKANKIYQSTKDFTGESACQLNLGFLMLASGSIDKAIAYFESARSLDSDANDVWGVAEALDGLAQCWIHLGQLQKAEACLSKSLTIRLDLTDRPGIVETLESCAVLSITKRRFHQAAMLLGVCRATRASLGLFSTPYRKRTIEEALNQVRSILDIEQCEVLLKHGEDLSVVDIASDILASEWRNGE
jgi:predicted ATPase/class 3 adenylate cyclase